MSRLYNSGYDKGPVQAKRVTTDTSAFAGILSTADDTVQKALDTLDNYTPSAPAASSVTVVVTGFDNNLSAADNTVQKALDTIDDLRGFKIVVNPQVDNYTLALTDAYKLVEMNKGTAVTLTVPKNAVVAFPIGTTICVIQKGAGLVTFAPVDGDVTILSYDSALSMLGQYAGATLTKVATNTWYLTGAIE